MFKIEKGVPPPKKIERISEPLVAWGDFAPGDSVFLPLYTNRAQKGFKQFNISLLNARFPGKKFTSRRVVNGGIAGLRVWRIE